MEPDHSLYRVVVLGDGGVGKTALTIQLCHQQFVEEYNPTIEDSYRTHVIIDDQRYLVEVLDTAGQEAYTYLQDQWINQSDGIILVYSVTSRDSFGIIKTLFQKVLWAKGWDPEDPVASTPTRLPIMIVGNKSDKFTERKVSTREGYDVAKDLGCEFIETSAKNNINVGKAFCDVVKILHSLSDRMASPRTPAWPSLIGIGGDGGCCAVM